MQYTPGTPFPCNGCGLCCQHVELLPELDRGDGVCHYYSESTKKCVIYHERPDVCRIRGKHELFGVSEGEWYAANIDACQKLQRDAGVDVMDGLEL